MYLAPKKKQLETKSPRTPQASEAKDWRRLDFFFQNQRVVSYFSGIMKCSSDHSSFSEFWSGVPVISSRLLDLKSIRVLYSKESSFFNRWASSTPIKAQLILLNTACEKMDSMALWDFFLMYLVKTRLPHKVLVICKLGAYLLHAKPIVIRFNQRREAGKGTFLKSVKNYFHFCYQFVQQILTHTLLDCPDIGKPPPPPFR